MADDLPARIVAAAANRFPAGRRDWGRAMVAELAQVQGRGPRWGFTASALRVAVFPPPRRRHLVLAVALAGLLAAAAATAAAAVEVPDLATSAAVLGLLLGGYATFTAARWTGPPRWTLPGVIAAGLAAVAVAAAIVAVIRIALAHPAAAADRTHVFAVLFALALAGYLTFAFTQSRGDESVLWWALGAALASGVVWTVIAVTTPVRAVGITGYLWPVGAAAVLTAAAGAAAATRSSQAGAGAGLLAAVLSAPMHFAADMTALLQASHFTLTTSYDVAAYPRSGFPDVASYLLSDALAGDILTGLVFYPIVLFGFAWLGATAGSARGDWVITR